jgi:hypothetical protein
MVVTTILRVDSFHERRMLSSCTVLESDDPTLYKGCSLWVDLTVSADFGEMPERELVGKTVEVDRFQPFELIGVGVRIKETA